MSQLSHDTFTPIFQDRHRERARTKELAMGDIPYEERQVLVFYGAGGHGKTTLSHEVLKELRNLQVNANEPHAVPLVTAELDFNANVRGENDRLPHLALKSLRLQVSRQQSRSFFELPGSHFPAFDLAFQVHHDKTSSTPFDNAHPELAAGNSYVELLIKTLDLGLGFAEYFWDLIGRKKATELWDIYRGGKLIDKEYLQSLTAPQLSDALIDCFGADITRLQWEHETEGELQVRKRRCKVAVFIDTYEALWEGTTEKTGILARRVDRWVQRLVESTPGVLYVITGRDEIKWEGSTFPMRIEQHRLEGLLWEDGDKALADAGVDDLDVRQAILQSAMIEGVEDERRVLPFILELDARTYGVLLRRHHEQQSPAPTSSDFGGSKHDVLARFLEHLDREERLALKYLSLPRAFDSTLFTHLKESFYPSAHVLFSDLQERSLYRNSTTGESLTIHALLRKHMCDHFREAEPSHFSEVNAMLHSWYDQKLRPDEDGHLPDDIDTLFDEANYHAEDKESASYLKWLTNSAFLLVQRNKGEVPLNALREAYDSCIFNRLDTDAEVATYVQYALLGRCLGNALRDCEEYASAEEVLRSTSQVVQDALDRNPKCALPQSGFSEEFKQTAKELADFLKPSEADGQSDLPIDGDRAKKLFPAMLQATPVAESDGLSLAKQLAYLKLALAELLEEAGGEENTSTASTLFDEALAMATTLMPGLDVIRFIVGLATFLDSRGRHVEAEPHLFNALAVYLGTGQPRSAAVMAHDLAKCLRNQGRIEEALRFNEMAHGWFTKNDIREGLDHAIGCHTRGAILCEGGKYADALPSLEEARSHYEEHLPPNHRYFHLLFVDLALAAIGVDDVAEAERNLHSARATAEVSVVDRDKRLARWSQVKGEIAMRAGKYEEAVASLRSALVTYEEVEGLDRNLTKQVLASLVEAYKELGDEESAGHFNGHLDAARQSSDMRLQIEGMPTVEVVGEDRSRILGLSRMQMSLPDDESVRVHKIATDSLVEADLYQFTISGVYGPVVKYAFMLAGEMPILVPVTWTNEAFLFLLSIGRVQQNKDTAIDFAKLFCSGIRTRDDQFWIVTDKNKVPSQRTGLEDTFEEDTAQAIDSVAPPHVVDEDYVIDLFKEDIYEYNEEHGTDWSFEKLLDTTDYDDAGENGQEQTFRMLRLAAANLARDTERIFVEAHMVHTTGVFRVVLGMQDGGVIDMLLDSPLANDPMVGFRKTIGSLAK